MTAWLSAAAACVYKRMSDVCFGICLDICFGCLPVSAVDYSCASQQAAVSKFDYQRGSWRANASGCRSAQDTGRPFKMSVKCSTASSCFTAISITQLSQQDFVGN
jgi:hypothetical protein